MANEDTSRRTFLKVAGVGLAGAAVGQTSAPNAPTVRVVQDAANRKVDILMNGELFTSYTYPTTLKKPVLYPLRSPEGLVLTRGFPPGLGEHTDHPHHVGLWFNYGNVNGIDFWNNSDAIKPQDRPKMGTIEHRRVLSTKNGSYNGELEVEADWVGPDGKPMLRERTLFIFHGNFAVRSVDRLTTLTAVDRKMTFNDDKEGMLGLRVTRALELPSDKPTTFTDSSGRATKVAAADSSVATGDYLTSEGTKGAAVWGTRAKWCSLGGRINQKPVTITILDHPQNPGFPTYWHARGYGLFAANPLGQKVFSNGKEQLNFSVEPNQSAKFRYRILIVSQPISAERAQKEYVEFAKVAK